LAWTPNASFGSRAKEGGGNSLAGIKSGHVSTGLSKQKGAKKMNYKIECNGIIIAEFINEHDRNSCMELLAREYEDCEFKAINE
jgi:hypothetical protein